MMVRLMMNLFWVAIVWSISLIESDEEKCPLDFDRINAEQDTNKTSLFFRILER